ncbi:hypothetical protein [Paenibacillus pinisoli]|uniref:hypothetical protein n=1 Tax=Paenibacillus pinisoli TaxID=1276110 RepID=UPI00105847BE|nr:hypothetical protein [Paenibacillus pinisoli]
MRKTKLLDEKLGLDSTDVMKTKLLNEKLGLENAAVRKTKLLDEKLGLESATARITELEAEKLGLDSAAAQITELYAVKHIMILHPLRLKRNAFKPTFEVVLKAFSTFEFRSLPFWESSFPYKKKLAMMPPSPTSVLTTPPKRVDNK